MPNDQTTLEEAKAHYRQVRVHAAKAVTRISSLQRSAKKKPGGWPWGKAVSNVETEARATSDAEDKAWAKLAAWANSNE